MTKGYLIKIWEDNDDETLGGAIIEEMKYLHLEKEMFDFVQENSGKKKFTVDICETVLDLS